MAARLDRRATTKLAGLLRDPVVAWMLGAARYAGEQELGAVGETPDITEDPTQRGWVVNPAKMPGPRKIACPHPERPDAGQPPP